MLNAVIEIELIPEWKQRDFFAARLFLVRSFFSIKENLYIVPIIRILYIVPQSFRYLPFSKSLNVKYYYLLHNTTPL